MLKESFSIKDILKKNEFETLNSTRTLTEKIVFNFGE